jgi:hypothetical protein
MPLYPDFRSAIQSTSGKEEYFVSDEDSSGTTKYYGMITRTGAWLILKNDTTAKSYRYAVGKYDYVTNWTGRAGLTYKYFNQLP